jgi:hypothetical protein
VAVTVGKVGSVTPPTNYRQRYPSLILSKPFCSKNLQNRSVEKHLTLQPLQAILPNALRDDPVQRRGADFIRSGPQEPDVPGFLADKAKSQTQIAIFAALGALFEAFPNCIPLFISHSFSWVMTTFQRTTGKRDRPLTDEFRSRRFVRRNRSAPG